MQPQHSVHGSDYSGWWAVQLWKSLDTGFFVSSILLVHVYECFAYVYMCHVHARCLQESQRRMLDPLELELQMFISHCVDAKTKPVSSSARATSPLNYSAMSPSLPFNCGYHFNEKKNLFFFFFAVWCLVFLFCFFVQHLTYYTSQSGFELVFLLPLSHKFWDYRHLPSGLDILF